MTAPRQVLPGTTYLVTRRCSQRQFLLRPSKIVNEMFLFVLAVAAARFDICVHAFCVMSNHFHIILTDTHARLPAFQQFLDSLVARALNALLGRWENFWDPASYSAVVLASPADILEKTAYLLANPVAAGLVRHGKEWPGLWSPPPEQIGTTIKVSRPNHFFDPKGSLPEEISLRLSAPPGFASATEFREKLSALLTDREKQAALDHQGRFLGVAKVLAQKPTDTPRPGEPRRDLNPRIAARDKWKRIEMLGRLVGFLRAYRTAWAARRAGALDTVFPQGTYLLRVLHGAPCVGFG